MEVAGSDLLGGDRQRNIFPLPPISDDFPSEPHSLGWSSMVNQGINALNVLAGCTNSLNSKKKPTRVQRRALQHISDAFKDVSVVHECDPGRSSLDDLCSSSRLYQVDRSDVVSYARELVSWPKVETSPIPLERCLPVADIEWLATWRQHMLKPEGSCDNPNSPKRPYMDPILKHKQNDYENFIRELRQRHMIKFKLDTSDAGDLGIFFVRKKNGSQRLIFDTRILNNKFLDPPSTDLPSADAFTRVEMPENQPFYIGSGDLANAFYTLSVPDDLGRMFTLPAVRADRIGIDEVDGNTLRPGTMVCPYLIVLPMGWSWALHLCQSVMMHAISQSGFCSQQIISDKRAPVRISNSDDMACGGYVDNFVVIGTDPEAVNAGLARISERLRSLGLTVHEEEPASLHATFVGLDFNGSSGVVSLKPQRILNLQKAIRELLLRNFASGDLLQLILGHITWALMCRREGLSILKSCYAFVHQNQSKACRLWPSVRFELDLIASLLPLFRTKLNVGWSDDICASDSSPFGYGICHRKGEREVIQAVGSQSERWRFRFEDAVDARRHAAKTGGFKELSKSQCNGGYAEVCKDEHVNHIFDEGFNNSIFDEVPHALLNPNDWSVVWSHPWKHQDNILHTEALALVWSIEHALRANRNFGKRILFLADNLPLTLSVCKGRAKSSFLTRPLRKICALALATGSRIHVRWIPSEWNVADQPSRALNQWSSRGLKSWFSDDCSSGSRFERARRKFGSPPRFEGHTDKEPGAGQGEDLEEAGSGETGCNSSPWHDIPGVPKCENTNDSGLHKEVSGVSGLDEHASDQHSITPGPRLCSSGVPRGPVRGQSGCQRRGEGHRSDQVFLAPFSKGNPPDQPGTERLELLAAPPQQRMPVPIEVLSAIMGVFLQRGSRESALRLFIQFVTYMRPGECSQLLVKQLVRPQGSVNQSFNFWAILLHPMEDLTPGKTGIFDGSVVLDSDLWVNVFLERLVHGKDPLQPLWSIPHGTFRDQFNKIIRQLQLDPLGLTLYALRHGGATHDVLARRRPILEVKQRGRWSSDSSLKRYVKEARLQAELSKVPRSIKEFGQLVLQNLPVFMENPSLVPKKVNGIIM